MNSFKEIYADKFCELIMRFISKTSAFAQHIEYRNPMNGDKENLESWHNEAKKTVKDYMLLLQTGDDNRSCGEETTTQLKYTPSPWRMTSGGGRSINIDDGSYYIANLGLQPDGSINPNNEANARLITQSPMMFEALEMIAGIRPCPNNLMGNVDIAIHAITNVMGDGQ